MANADDCDWESLEESSSFRLFDVVEKICLDGFEQFDTSSSVEVTNTIRLSFARVAEGNAPLNS